MILSTTSEETKYGENNYAMVFLCASLYLGQSPSQHSVASDHLIACKAFLQPTNSKNAQMIREEYANRRKPRLRTPLSVEVDPILMTPRLHVRRLWTKPSVSFLPGFLLARVQSHVLEEKEIKQTK